MDVPHPLRAAARRVSQLSQTQGNPEPLRFEDVFAEEQTAIEKRRTVADSLRPGAGRGPVAGLAFSGGGIRSATLCLGVLQALSELRQLLTRFDYLSTVSGGGFAGGWWVAWLSRHLGNGKAPPPSLFPCREDVWLDGGAALRTSTLAGKDPVRFLRLFSNYLTPRKGAFSEDTWRAVTVVVRNLALTWLSVLPLLFATLWFMQAPLALLPQFTDGCDTAHVAACWTVRWRAVSPVFGWLGAVVALLVTAETIAWLVVAAKFGHRPRTSGKQDTEAKPESNARFWRIVATAVAQALFVALILFHPSIGPRLRLRFALGGGSDPSMQWTWLGSALVFLALYWPLATIRYLNDRRDLVRTWIVRIHATTHVVAACVFVALGFAAFGDLAWRSTVAAGQWGWAKAGGLAGIAATLAGALYSALKSAPAGGGDAAHREQRGTSRLTAMVLAVTPWLVMGVLACLGAWLGRRLFQQVFAADLLHAWVVAGTLAGATLALAMALAELEGVRGTFWLILGAATFWMTREAVPAVPVPVLQAAITAALALLAIAVLRSDPGSTRARRHRLARVLFVLIALLGIVVTWRYSGMGPSPTRQLAEHARDAAALLFIASALALRSVVGRRLPAVAMVLLGLSMALTALVGVACLRATGGASWWGFTTFLGLGGTAVASALALGWMIDPNLVSLHGFYRDRLVRAYLGASNPKRGATDAQVTDSVEGDDLPLGSARSDTLGGPLPLVNATLNLLGAHDLGVVQRRCASFTLSPLHCGSVRTGFRRADDYMSGALTLGGAVAMSGAAASPAMGTLHVSGAQAVLLTLLNIRLGFWAPNPGEHSWRLPQARLWTLAMLRELLSQTDETSSYCYLTDGGHFDNTAIYPLVQRACSVIVVVDSGRDQDPPQLGDLAQAIRLCRIDFGAEITLPLAELGKSPVAPVMVGQIRYSADHLALLGLPPDRAEGVIVCIKPGIWSEAGLPADVLQYRCEHPEFPQQSTGDQWFDEAQFESYRRLGVSLGEKAAPIIVEQLGKLERPASAVRERELRH